jgi:hypothetical protein
MGIISTPEKALITPLFLETHPDISLDIFDQMAYVNGPIGIGQGTGNQNFSIHHRLRATSLKVKITDYYVITSTYFRGMAANKCILYKIMAE